MSNSSARTIRVDSLQPPDSMLFALSSHFAVRAASTDYSFVVHRSPFTVRRSPISGFGVRGAGFEGAIEGRPVGGCQSPGAGARRYSLTSLKLWDGCPRPSERMVN